MPIEKLPRPSGKELEILILMYEYSSAEIYGYQLIELSKGSLKKGSIYSLLQRMSDNKLVTSRKEPREKGARGLPRRMFKLTGLGQRTASAYIGANNEFLSVTVGI